jgi:protein phosphatase
LVQELIDSGTITEEEAEKHPNKNIITRALGTSNDVNVDIFYLDLNDVYKVLLCTDGLSNMVTYCEMYDIVTKNSNEEACKKLVELSKLKGGKDNISVVIFEGKCENGTENAR